MPMLKKIISILIVLVSFPVFAMAASEITGELDTGMDTGFDAGLMIPPTATPGAGSYTTAQTVTLAATGSSGICWAMGGTVPVCAYSGTACTTGTFYGAAIGINSSNTLRAVSCYPNGYQSAVAVFAYTITGGGGGGGGGGGSTPNNQNPIAQNDTASTTKNVTKTIDVLANDSDPDGDHADLMIVGVTEGSGFKGTLQVSGDGRSVVYQPKNNDTGAYDFTYTIQDADGGTATATVVINVTN